MSPSTTAPLVSPPASRERAYCIENHDEAYSIWRDAGARGRVVVHMDAHHDLYGKWKGTATSPVTIANYLFAAIDQRIVREIVWVIPDDAWETPRRRRDIGRQLAAIDGRDKPVSLDSDGRRLATRVAGIPVTTCSLCNLPTFDEAVLLDIDVDYLVDPGVTGSRHRDLPWCWPEDLAAGVRSRAIRWDVATIAYSVEGGYTPLQWKYLGDEIAQRLEGSSAPVGMAEMRRGATLATRGDFAAACSSYERAKALLPSSSAPDFHLAHALVAMGQLDAGRDHYRAAMSLDPSYRTPFNSQALWYHECGRPADAERAFRHVLRLDPDDAWAHLGLGILAADARRWHDAEAFTRRSLALNPTGADAWRTLAQSLDGQKRHREAIEAYERSLKLGLQGRPSIHVRSIVTRPFFDHLSDPYHAETHARLAYLYAKQGKVETAIRGLQIGTRLGMDTPGSWTLLALLHGRRGEWRKATAAGRRAARNLPASVARRARQIADRIRRASARAVSRTPVRRSSPALWD